MRKAILRIAHREGGTDTMRVSATTMLGRGSVLTDRRVSKTHASLEPTANGWLLRDLGSNNGTLVNGSRVAQIALADGDVIEIGPYKLTFELEVEESGAIELVADDGLADVTASIDSASAGAFPAADRLDATTLRARYEKLRVAHALSLELGLERDPAALFKLILAFCMSVFTAETGVALMRDRGGWRVVAQRSDRRDGPLVLSQTILARVSDTREGLLLEDVTQAEAFTAVASIQEAGVRSVLAVPVVVEDRTRAILILANRSQTHAFARQDLEILSGIASQAAVALERAELADRIEKEAATRAHLARFLSPALMDQVNGGRLDVDLGRIAKQPIVVLFSDIRGFTSFSERMGPEETVRMLNEHFEVMVDCVFRYGGVLDKFIGDSVMAIWGAPVARPDDAERALTCAVDMLARLEMVNATRVAAGKSRVETGIGVHYGDGVVGAIGSPLRLEFTAIGDTVNLAARLCAEAGQRQILTTRSTLARAGDKLVGRALPPVTVKGKAAPIEVCVVEGYQAVNLRP
jgi:adenylate cyclase